MNRRLLILILSSILILLSVITIILKNSGVEPQKLIEKSIGINKKEYTIGKPVDSLNGVYVYYNGPISNVCGRNVSADGYNIGQKYQCVEFVKRYYYQYLHHKMPDSYGHAKDFFNTKLKDGQKNKARGLIQFSNPGKSKPKPDDLVVFGGTDHNPYGHVAIISFVSNSEIEIIQQNPGPYASSRVRYPLKKINGKWKINNENILGWLRK
ncbi:hypothetical protein SDC9_52378 [bioreactor metagenome]|uniref:Peptidase C51 domain-containing protein n=1 Tax=bioreactor metagenome TaxID=1076179 RepID=A0A644WVH7_9ZZZZ